MKTIYLLALILILFASCKKVEDVTAVQTKEDKLIGGWILDSSKIEGVQSYSIPQGKYILNILKDGTYNMKEFRGNGLWTYLPDIDSLIFKPSNSGPYLKCKITLFTENKMNLKFTNDGYNFSDYYSKK